MTQMTKTSKAARATAKNIRKAMEQTSRQMRADANAMANAEMLAASWDRFAAELEGMET